jgi:hypothetical protein
MNERVSACRYLSSASTRSARTVHHSDAARLAVLPLDAVKTVAQHHPGIVLPTMTS